MRQHHHVLSFVVGAGAFFCLLLVIAMAVPPQAAALAQVRKSVQTKKIATATLMVTSKPKGAMVSIYGSDPKGKHTPATFTGLKPGNIYLCADQDDQKNHTYVEIYFKAVKLTAGKTTSVVIDFNKPDDGPPEGDGGPGTPTPMDKLMSAIPYRTGHFQVTEPMNPARYDVLIIPKIEWHMGDNPREVYAKNWKRCEQYGKEALRWIQSKGVNLRDIRICWSDWEFWPPGKTIKL